MTKKKLKDQEHKFQQTAKHNTILATILIILSGLILYLDKIFLLYDINLKSIPANYASTEDFIWFLCQTISPIIMMIGFYLKPYKEALLVPLFCYMVQMYFVLDDSLTNDMPLLMVYVVGTMIIVTVITIALSKFLARRKKLSRFKNEVMKEIIKTDDKILNPQNRE